MSYMEIKRFRVYFKAKIGCLRFRVSDAMAGGTLTWLTEAEAYQLRDALNDAIDVCEERRLTGHREMVNQPEPQI